MLSPLFGIIYRCEVIIRCVDLFRRTQIKFLPTRCRTFGFLAELGAQKGAQKGSGQRHCRRPPGHQLNIHDERSFSMWRSTNPSKGAKGSITRSMVPPSVSRAVQCSRSDHMAKNVEIAHDGMEAADPPHGGRRPRQSAPGAHFWALLGT